MRVKVPFLQQIFSPVLYPFRGGQGSRLSILRIYVQDILAL
jgi:hypothetical protein